MENMVLVSTSCKSEVTHLLTHTFVAEENMQLIIKSGVQLPFHLWMAAFFSICDYINNLPELFTLLYKSKCIKTIYTIKIFRLFLEKLRNSR